MKKILLFIIFCLFSVSVSGINNIYEFDEKSDIIITTSVYKDGVPYDSADCNLTIFNPPPNENFINLSVYMENKGNGVYSYDLTSNITYNDEIYPLTLSCNGSDGFVGYDERVGIKIGTKMYDYIIPGAILVSIAILFIIISFKLPDNQEHFKLLMFYFGFAFILGALFYGLSVVDKIPNGGGIKTIFVVTIIVFLILLALMIYLQFVDKISEVFNSMLGSK